MRYLEVGAGKHISKIGLGTHQFGSSDWGYDDRYAEHEANAIVSRALELGSPSSTPPRSMVTRRAASSAGP